MHSSRLFLATTLFWLCAILLPVPVPAAQSAAETQEIAALEQQVLAAQNATPVAMVNGVAIPRWMFDNALRDRLATLPAAERDRPDALARERQAVLENLLQMELLAQEAARRDVAADIGAGYLRAGIMAKAHGNDLLFAKALAKAGMTRQQYVEIWKQQVSVNRLVSEVLQPGIVIDDAALRARYDQDKPQLIIPRRAQVQELFAPWTSPTPGTPDDLSALTPPFTAAARALSRTDDFLAGAQALEQGELKDIRGLKYRARGWVAGGGNATLEQAGWGGWKPGDTVGPFPSDQGLHVWRVLAMEEPRQAGLEDVRQELAVQLRDEATREAIARKVQELRTSASVVITLQ